MARHKPKPKRIVSPAERAAIVAAALAVRQRRALVSAGKGPTGRTDAQLAAEYEADNAALQAETDLPPESSE